MSIEGFLADQRKNKPRQFKDVARKLLSEKKEEDARLFQWEEEITSQELNAVTQALGTLSRLKLWQSYMHDASCLRILDPKLPVRVEQKGLDFEMKQCKKFRSSDNWIKFAIHSSKLHLLDPNRDLHIDDAAWEKMSEVLHQKIISEMLFLEMATAMHLLDPQRNLHITKEQLDDLQILLKTVMTDSVWDFMKIYFQMRLILPDFHPLTDGNQWNSLIENLEFEKKSSDIDHWFRKVHMVAQMRVIAAFKVEVTKDGILITDEYPTTLDIAIPSRPIRKKL